MHRIQPEQLEDLFPVFDRMASGDPVLLGLPGDAADLSPTPPGPGAWLGVRSSGSTGVPKVVWCEWSRLCAEARVDGRTAGWRWMSPFHPTSFAGVQVALQAWRGGGAVGSLTSDWDSSWRRLAAARCDALSSTPTYLDLLLQNEPAGHGAEDPRQVTLGGEVLRPALGERLRRRFPSASFTVVYASAEFGVLLKTHRLDGWYGTEALEHRHRGWRVGDGMLEVSVDGVWRATGDLVEVRDGLVRVVGRGDRVANVAGTKVNLDEVARHAEEVPGVRRALAVPAPSPVTGQVVCLRFAPEPGADPAEVRGRLEAHLRSALPKPAWPRQWDLDPLLPARNAKRSLGGPPPP